MEEMVKGEVYWKDREGEGTQEQTGKERNK